MNQTLDDTEDVLAVKSPAYAGMNRCFANSKRANAQKPRVCEDMLCIACIAVKGRRTDRIVLQKS